MMCLLLLALLGGQPASAQEALDRCVAAHRTLSEASIFLSTESRVSGLPAGGSSFEVAFKKPSRLRLRVIEPARGSQPETDRTYTLSPGRFLGYDASTNEVLSRSAPDKGSLMERLVLLLGSVDDGVQTVVDTSVMASFMERFQLLRDWSMKRRAGLLLLEHRTGANVARIELDSSQFLLRGVRLETAQGHVAWTVRYGARPQSVSFTPPATAVEVEAFYVGSSATFASAKAKSVAHASIKAYESVRRAVVTVRTGSTQTRFWLDGRKARQEGGGAEWAYDGSVATIRDRRRGLFYSGRTTYSELLGALAAAEQPLEPTLRLLMARRNPMRELLGPGMKAGLGGTIEVDGRTCDLLEIDGPSLRVTAWVSQDSKLIVRLTTENRDMKGAIVSESEKTFSYAPVVGPLPSATFRLGSDGLASKPLAELGALASPRNGPSGGP